MSTYGFFPNGNKIYPESFPFSLISSPSLLRSVFSFSYYGWNFFLLVYPILRKIANHFVIFLRKPSSYCIFAACFPHCSPNIVLSVWKIHDIFQKGLDETGKMQYNEHIITKISKKHLTCTRKCDIINSVAIVRANTKKRIHFRKEHLIWKQEMQK